MGFAVVGKGLGKGGLKHNRSSSVRIPVYIDPLVKKSFSHEDHGGHKEKLEYFQHDFLRAFVPSCEKCASCEIILDKEKTLPVGWGGFQ
jgi:hypothetical protein